MAVPILAQSDPQTHSKFALSRCPNKQCWGFRVLPWRSRCLPKTPPNPIQKLPFRRPEISNLGVSGGPEGAWGWSWVLLGSPGGSWRAPGGLLEQAAPERTFAALVSLQLLMWWSKQISRKPIRASTEINVVPSISIPLFRAQHTASVPAAIILGINRSSLAQVVMFCSVAVFMYLPNDLQGSIGLRCPSHHIV